MRIFEILDDELLYGYLFYQDNNFHIVLVDNNYWDVPLLLDSFLDKQDRYINSKWSMKWVQERIVPKNRQNIGNILKVEELKEYNEFSLLLLTKGRCSQDDCFIKEIEYEKINEDVKEVLTHRVLDFLPISDNTSLVVFYDGKVKKIDMNDIVVDHVLKMDDYIFNYSIDRSGFDINIQGLYSIDYHTLYNKGVDIGLSMPEIDFFLKRNLVTTNEAIEILKCSRQNLDMLVKRDKLHPIIDKNKTRLFKKSEILQYSNK